MANILNTFFHSVFNPREAEPPTSTQSETLSSPTLQLCHIELPDFEVVEVLRHLVLGIRGSLLSWFHSYLTHRQQRVVLNGICSDWLPVTSGVSQGSILGPLLFLVYCNDAQYYIQENSTLALFADNSKLFRSLDVSSSIISLQQDLNSLQKWSVNMKMQFNTKKCKVMHVSRKKLKTQTSYYLAGQQLEQVTHVTDLGITVSNDLSWSKHIEITAAKTNKTLGLIKRICRDISDPATRRLLYCTLVRPKLEYASAVSSPNTVKHRSLIENIQRRAKKIYSKLP